MRSPLSVDAALPPVPQFVVLGVICVVFNTAVDVAVVLGASGATMVVLGLGMALLRHER